MTPIQQFYNKKSVFLTGGTGFLGKGKLLRINILKFFYINVKCDMCNTSSKISDFCKSQRHFKKFKQKKKFK